MDKLRNWLSTFELREGDMTKDFDRFEKLEKIWRKRGGAFPDDIQRLYRRRERMIFGFYFEKDEPKILYKILDGNNGYGYGTEVQLKQYVSCVVRDIFFSVTETERRVHHLVKGIFERVEFNRKWELGTLLAKKIRRDFGSAYLFESRTNSKAMYLIQVDHYDTGNTFEGQYYSRKRYLHIHSRGLRVLNQPCGELTTMRMIAGEIEIFQT